MADISILSRARDEGYNSKLKTCELTDADFFTLTGIAKTNFDDLCSHIPSAAIRDTHIRSMRTCIGIFLTKLRSGMSNKFLATMFNISKDSIKRAISSARDTVKQNFPLNASVFTIFREKT